MAQLPNAMIVSALVRQALVAAQEVMGEHGLNTVLRTSGLERYIGNLPPDNLEPAISTSDYARLNEAIESFYGRGGRGMLRRIGKASFLYATREQAALLGLAGVALKLLPTKQRIKFILGQMVGALKKTNPQVDAWVEDTEGRLAYIERTCAICYGRQSAQPVCYLYIGSISEAVRWATGTDYEVRETHCIAKGDEYCRFEIGEPIM
jgi:hypothetical protein